MLDTLLFVSMSLVGLLSPPIHLYQSYSARAEISRRLDALTQNLTAQHEKDWLPESKPSVAVFPFAASDGLQRERFGLAIARLLARRLAESSKVVVVRHAQLSRIMRERNLSPDDSVDVRTAIRVGKLVGAQYIVFGSIARDGESYVINAEMQQTTIMPATTTATQELPAAKFEKAARRFLAPVAPPRTFGVYYLYNYRHNANRVGDVTYNQLQPPLEYMSTTSPASFQSELRGIGLRYFPIPKCMIDLSASTTYGATTVANDVAPAQTVLGQTSAANRGIVSLNEIMRYRLNIDWVHPLKYGFSSMLGIGASWYEMELASPYRNPSSSVVPSIRGGLEYQRRSRWAVSLFLNYDLLAATGEYSAGRHPVGATAFRLSKLSIEPTLAFYF